MLSSARRDSPLKSKSAHRYTEGQRVEILWDLDTAKGPVTRWIPGTILGMSCRLRSGTRCYAVVSDSGLEADMASPDCIRPLRTVQKLGHRRPRFTRFGHVDSDQDDIAILRFYRHGDAALLADELGLEVEPLEAA